VLLAKPNKTVGLNPCCFNPPPNQPTTVSESIKTHSTKTLNPSPRQITMFRQAIARQARLFSTAPIARKSVVDSAKETVQQVDKTVAQAAVKGIEKGGTY
jgi:hypothetical protein